MTAHDPTHPENPAQQTVDNGPFRVQTAGGAASTANDAAGAFTRRHSVQADRGARLLAGATVMLAGASYYHVVPVSLSPGQVSLSVLLPTVALALILAAAVRQELQAASIRVAPEFVSGKFEK